MDDFKKANNKDMTAFDLNCRKFVDISKEGRKTKRMFRKTARSRLKQQLREENYDGD